MTTEKTPQGRKIESPPEVSTLKPILRKPILQGTKRRLDDDDDDDSVLLQSSPTKKRKTVQFNESLNMVREINNKSLAEAQMEIKKALDGHAKGDDGDYDMLRETFAPLDDYGDDESDADEEDVQRGKKASEELLIYVVAMANLATDLSNNCAGLVRSVLRCTWLERDDRFARRYIQLLANLSSVKTSYRSSVLTMIVDNFTPSADRPVQVRGYPPVDAVERAERLHTGLNYLLDKFPDGQRMLFNIIRSHFPFHDATREEHMVYINHLLRLTKTRPAMEREIMALIFEKLVEIDSNFSLDFENDDDDTTREVLRKLNGVKNENGVDDSDAESELSDDEEEDDAQRIRIITNRVESMDAILELLFEIYDPMFKDPDSETARKTFHDLLNDFIEYNLPKLNARSSQYLIFKFAMKSPTLIGDFTGTLLNVASENTELPGIKEAATSYVASFTARGAQVTSVQVQKIFKTLLDYAEYYRTRHLDARGPDVRSYRQYYAYFQGVLYIFCFRWRDLIDKTKVPPSVDWDDPASFVGHDLPWVTWLKPRLSAQIASKLNPLKCCSPIIVEEFARLSLGLGLMYIYNHIEENKAVQLAQFFTGGYAQGGSLRDTGLDLDSAQLSHLNSAFPFDPIQLPRARQLLDLPNTYKEWQPVRLLERKGNDSGETGDETEVGDLESVHEETATDDENAED